MTYTAYTESLVGSDFTGSNGGSNRTYTIPNADVTSAAFLVQDNGFLLTQNYDFTVSGQLLTISIPVYDTDIITLNYLTDSTPAVASSTGSLYTTVSLVSQELRLTEALSASTTPTMGSVYTWIQEESRVIELMSGEIFSSTVVSSEYVDYDGSGLLRFPKAPLLSIQGIRYNENNHSQDPSWVTLQSGRSYNYLEYLTEGEAEFISGINATNKIIPNPGKLRLCLSYTYGYASIPLEIQRLATLMTAKRFIMTLVNNQASSEGGAIRVGTIMVSDPTNFSSKYITDLNTEINNSLASMGRNFKTFRLNRVYD